MTEEQLSWFVDDTFNKRLLAVPGVAQVNRSGGVDREIRVDLDPARMQSFGITAAEVNDQLRQVNVDAAGGRAQVGGSEQSIRVLGGARTAQQLANTRLTVGMLGTGQSARLGDIADVRDGIAEVRSISGWTAGRPPRLCPESQGGLGRRASRRVDEELPRSARRTPAST
jgi:multidrug efflux pump subunit AcrB